MKLKHSDFLRFATKDEILRLIEINESLIECYKKSMELNSDKNIIMEAVMNRMDVKIQSGTI